MALNTAGHSFSVQMCSHIECVMFTALWWEWLGESSVCCKPSLFLGLGPGTAADTALAQPRGNARDGLDPNPVRNGTATGPAPPAAAGAAATIEAGTAPGRGAESAAPERGECYPRNKWFFPTHNENFHSKLSLCLPLSNFNTFWVCLNFQLQLQHIYDLTHQSALFSFFNIYINKRVIYYFCFGWVLQSIGVKLIPVSCSIESETADFHLNPGISAVILLSVHSGFPLGFHSQHPSVVNCTRWR